MGSVNITLVNTHLTSKSDKFWTRGPLLSLGYLAASLLEKRHRVSAIDGKIEGLSAQGIVDKINKDVPDLVGITAMTLEIYRAVEIAAMIKKSLPDTPVIIGGAHANALPRQTLEIFNDFDFLIYGQGEETLCELAEEWASGGGYANIAGLVYRENGVVRQNPPRIIKSNLAKLPLPAWHLFPSSDILPLQGERGCPFTCVFCSHNMGKKIRSRPPEHIVEEIEYDIERFKPKFIAFNDETFGLNGKKTVELLHLMIERGLGKKVRFGAQTRVDLVDGNFYRLMKEAGFWSVSFGIESGNQEVLNAIGKNITLSMAEDAIKLARKAGLKVLCFFILGNPNETVKSINDTIKFAIKAKPHRASFSLMVPYPGTQVYEWAKKGEMGYRLISDNWALFDKYSGGVLELEAVSIRRLKFYQFKAFLLTNLFNMNLSFVFRMMLKFYSLPIEIIRQIFSLKSKKTGERR